MLQDWDGNDRKAIELSNLRRRIYRHPVSRHIECPAGDAPGDGGQMVAIPPQSLYSSIAFHPVAQRDRNRAMLNG